MGCFQKLGGGPPKWMVKIMENLIKMNDLGGFPPSFGSTHINFRGVTFEKFGDLLLSKFLFFDSDHMLQTQLVEG